MQKTETGIILIVDDNPTNLGALFKFLNEFGFKVLVAVDGESAIEQIKYAPPDMILLDVMMPEIDGFETCRLLKLNPDTQEIPVIFMTALSDTIDKVKGFNLGAVDYITKPIQHEEVLSRIKTHLTLRSLQRELQQKNEALTDLNQNLELLVEQKTKQLISQEKDAIMGRLIQGLVHNLRNPLQTLLIMSEMIEVRGQEMADHSILEYITYVKDAGNRIKEMTDNLAVKSSLDHNIKLQSVNLNQLLQQEIRLLEAHNRFKYKIQKQYIFDETIPEILMIASHFSQVFHNLVNNAIDAMWNSPVQSLTIITRQDQERVYMDVKDTGCGIPLEVRPQIFDIFFTSKAAKGFEKKVDEDSQQNHQPTGTGLGLYTCVELLKQFNGKISFTSEVGTGSVFTVEILKPLEKSEYLLKADRHQNN